MRIHEGCIVCRKNAPLQPAAQPKPVQVPDYPFQKLSSDYFNHAGKQYLLLMDWYSGWPVVGQCKDESANELIRMLQSFFGTYDVPEELATDGGALYVSKGCKDLL